LIVSHLVIPRQDGPDSEDDNADDDDDEEEVGLELPSNDDDSQEEEDGYDSVKRIGLEWVLCTAMFDYR